MPSQILDLISSNESSLLDRWLAAHAQAASRRRDLMTDAQHRAASQRFLQEFRRGLAGGADKILTDASWDPIRAYLQEISHERTVQGFSPSETALFVLSLKQPLFDLLRAHYRDDAEGLGDDIWRATAILDGLALFTTEVHQRAREQIIARQQQEMMELSTPVVSLWENVLALPLIGTLDSGRTQVVMENLLGALVRHGAAIAIIDITGVPTVDTLVAQHLLKTVSAARLMGADCIISGIRPQVAQTIIHLGVDLAGVTTKATLADAFQLALTRLGHRITRNTARVEGA